MHKHLQVVLVPFPLQGHLTPMLDLGTILHSKGFSVVVMHALFNAPNPSNYPDFIFRPIMENLTDLVASPENLRDLINVLNAHGESAFRKCLTELMEQNEPCDKVVCIVNDILMFFTENVAKEMKLPNILLQSTSASAIRAYSVLPRLHEEGYIPLQDSMIEEQVPGLQPLKFKDLSLSEIGSIEEMMPLIVIATNTGSASAVIWNTNDYLEHSALSQLQQLVYHVPIFSVGPLHKMAPTSPSSLLKEDTSCITWLNKQAPLSVIYVSVGSLANLDATELTEMAWGLANSHQPFLWVVRPGCARDSEWIEFLPEGFKEAIGERGYIVKWAPQKEVLAHAAVGGFWTHCGWNSTMESISEGVPLICMPCFADQKINARYLSHDWKIGLLLEREIKKGDIEKAIKLLLVDKEGREMRLRANAMKEKFDLSVKTDGSTYNTLNDLLVFILSL